MKKITLMIFGLLMSFFAYAQLPVEHFDDPWTVQVTGMPAAPPNWVVINEFGPLQTWIQTITGNTQQPPFGGSGHSAYLQKENVAPTDAIPSDWLVSKAFPMVANAELKFQSRLTIAGDNGGIYKVYIMPDTGATPTAADFNSNAAFLLTTYSELTLNPVQTEWTEKTITIPANALWAPGTQVRVAFVMQGDDKDRWFIDDVKVSAICTPPTTPVVTASTPTSASLSWNAGSATSWEIEVVADTAAPTGAGEVYSGTLPFVKTGLVACTNYKYYVRALCSDGGISTWVGPILFKTRCLGDTCEAPIVLGAGNVSVTGNTSTNSDFYEGISGTGCGSTGNYLAGNDVVYSYTPTATGNYNINLGGTGGPAGVFVYSSCANIGVSCLTGGLASATAAYNNASFAMTAGTTYYFVISTNGTPQTTAYTLTIQQVFCPQPTAGTVTGVTGTTATLGWTPGTVGSTSWQVVTQLAGSGLPSPANAVTFTSNTGNTVGNVSAPAVAPFQPATAYEFYVRESCGGGNYSIWAGPYVFTTTQVPATLNLVQNFDSGAHGFTLNNGTQINQWRVGGATFNSAANSLYISNDNGVTNAFTINATSVVQAYRDVQMPASIGQLSLSFDWKGFGESCCDYLRVWVVPASFTPTPGTQITAAASGGMQIGGNLNIQTNWQNSLTIINAPAAWNNQVMRLVFEWRNDSSVGSMPAAAVDNVNFSLVTCPQPTALTIGTLNTTTAVVNWTAPAIIPANGYDLYVANAASPAPTATSTPTQTGISGTSATITPLTPDTFYYVWVRANCGSTDKSFWTGPVMFSTPQVPATMDYTQNFDAGAHNFTLSNGTQTNKWVVGGATFQSAANSLYISNDNGVSNAYDIALQSVVHAYRDITIPGTVPSGQALLQFNWKCVAETGDYFRVWNVPLTYTPTPGTQITAAASGGTQIGGNFTGSAIWATSNNVVTIPAAQLGSTRRIIFEWFNNGFTGTQPPAAIDNINFKVITCPAPSALVLGTPLTTNSAVINWTAAPAAPANYEYYYSTTTTPPTDTTTPSGSVAGSTTTATITGLVDSTNYNVWVRSNCGGAAGTSFWIGPLNFNTPQIPAPMPYAQNFDAGASNYTLNNGTQTNKWVVGGATFNSPANSLYISNDNGATNNYTDSSLSVVQAYRDIQMPASIPTNQVLLQFDWKAAGESCCDYLRVYVVPVTFTPTPGTQMTNPTGGIQVGGNMNNNNTWTTVNNVLNATGWGGSIRRVIFEWRNDGSIGPSPGAAIDNINMSVITCSAPSALALTSIDAVNATFTWTASTPPAASYDYYLTTSPVAPTAGTVPTGNVTGTSLTLTGLPDSTNYYLWIRSNCGAADGTSFWVGGLNFNTPQIPVNLPYTQNFDTAGNPGFTYTMGTQPNKWVVGGATFNSASTSLYISNDNGVTNNYTSTAASTVHAYRDVVIPAGVTTLDFAFDWKNVGEAADYVRVWRVPLNFNPVAGTAITAVAGQRELVTTANLYGGSTWTTASYAPTVPAGTTQRFVFEWINNTFTAGAPPAAIDNISIKALTCPKPTNLTATNIGMTSATLGWTEAGTATAWEVYVVPQTAPAPGQNQAGTPAGSNPFLYEGMTPGTKYKYYVRAICGSGDNSQWSGPYNFNTNVCEIADQCPVNFILTDSGNNGWGGITMTVSQGGIAVGTLGPQLTTGGGPVTVTFPLCSGLPYEVFFNPGTGGANQVGLQIVNPFSNQTVFQRVAGTTASDQNTLIYTGIPYCSDITCPQPTNLVSESVVNAPNTTQLSWTPGGTETQWEVVIQPQGGAFPSTAPTTSVLVDEPHYVLANVTPGVPYEYYVRAICDMDTNDKSFWSGALRFSIFTPPACADVTVIDADLEIIAPDTEYVICPGEQLCVDFSASFYAAAAQTTSYEVESIPYVPPFPTLGGTPMPIETDDIWGPKVILPFEFCFMGDVYNAAQVGSNGIVSFNADQATGAGSGYAFSQTIPNATFPQRNAIYGVYQDTNPLPTNNSWDNPNINYQVMGNYPCRAFVVSFNELAQFNCSSDSAADQAIGAQSSQIVIYEITNIIEVYVKRRVPCTSWQGGVGLIGIQNAAGTVGFTPPGRNTGPWTANLEAWRFTPNGDTSVDFEWLQDGNFYSNDQDIQVCATAGTTIMTARASYSLCNGSIVSRESDFTIRVEEQIIPANDPVDLTKCGNGEDVTFDLTTAVADVFADPTGYTFTYYPTEQDAIDDTNAIANPTAFVTNVTTTVWIRIMKVDLPCFITRSFDAIISNVPPVFTVTPDASICDGTSATIAVIPDASEDLSAATYTWTVDGNPLPDTTSSIIVTVGGSYEVTVNKNGCVGTATSVVTVVAMPVADAPADVTACDSYVLPALSAGNNYYTGAGASGTMLSAGEDVGALLGAGAHTIYVYAVAPTLAACTDENTFVVTINATPVLDDLADVMACDSYVLEALTGNNAAANYYTAPDGAGTMLNAGDVISTTQTIYIYQATGTVPNCFDEESFTVTITETPVADAPVDVTVCDSYVLPALSAGNSYFTDTNGTGTPLSAGDTVTSTQLIFVYAVSQDNAACFSENSFTVNVTPTPQFSLGGPYVACLASNLTVSISNANFDLNTATYVWTINGASAGGNQPSIVGTEFGTYEVTVTVGTCSHTERIDVVNDTTVIDLVFTDICEENVYTLEVSDLDGSFNPDTASYVWTGPEGFTSTSRKVVPGPLGEYMVTVTTADGCVSIDTFEVTSTACEIPRGISPNNDGYNDVFDLTSLGVRKLSIFNRYGQEVYNKTSYTKEWHGQTNKGDELPTGTYFYMVERSTGETITGWVYINRQE